MSKPTPNQAQPAPPAPTSAAPTEAPRDWEEDDYILALAHLETIQYTISSLRLTIPQLTRSLTRQHATPQALFADFQKEVVGSSRKLADLKRLWDGAEMKEVQRMCEKGTQERGRTVGEDQDVRVAMENMGRYGWIEEGEIAREKNRNRAGEEGASEGQDMGDEEVEQLVEVFTKRNEAFRLEAKFERVPEWRIQVGYKSTDEMPLRIDIRKGTTSDGRGIYNTIGPVMPENVTKGEAKLFKVVERCLSTRPKQSDLSYTLDMVAAYRDIREAKCQTCKKVLDREGMFPAIRNSRKGKDGKMEWFAEHETCLNQKRAS